MSTFGTEEWLGSLGGGYFGTGGGLSGGSTSSWSNFDWGSTLGSIFGGGGGGTSSNTWADLAKGVLGGLLGGGGDGGGSSGATTGNIFSAMLGGIQGSADGKLAEAMVNKQGEWKLKDTQESGRQQRLTLDFTEQLKDFNAQKEKARKRAALDTYGAFSLTNRYAPSMPATPQVQIPTKPTVG